MSGSAEREIREGQGVIKQKVTEPQRGGRIVLGEVSDDVAQVFDRRFSKDYFPAHFGIMDRTSSTDLTLPSRAARMLASRARSSAAGSGSGAVE